METRTKKVSKNVFFGVLYQIVKMVLLFINRIIFIKILGVEYLGINGLFSNVLGLLSLADLGFSSVLMYSLYKPISKNDKKTINKLMKYFSRLYIYVAIIILIFGVSLIPFLKYIINLPHNISNIYLYYILLLINTVLSYVFISKTTLLIADQKQYIISIYDSIFQIILFIMQIIVLITLNDFSLYLLCNIICTVLSNILKVQKTKKIYPYISKKSNDELTKTEKKKITDNLKSLIFYKIGSVLQSNTDSILISIFSGTIIVGYYSNYNTLVIAMISFITLIFSAIKSSVGNYVATQKKQQQLELFSMLEIYNYILISFSSISFFVLAPEIITICFGKQYLLSTTFLVFLCLNYYTSNIRQNIWTYRETTGLFVKTKYITLITSFFNLIFSVIFAKYFGITGILVGSVISRFIYAWWKEPIILFNDYFKISSINYFNNYITRIFLTSIIVILLTFIFSKIHVNNIYFLAIIKILISSIIQIVLYYLIFKNSKAFNFIIKKIRGEKNEK